jgi:hypothetical protein
VNILSLIPSLYAREGYKYKSDEGQLKYLKKEVQLVHIFVVIFHFLQVKQYGMRIKTKSCLHHFFNGVAPNTFADPKYIGHVASARAPIANIKSCAIRWCVVFFANARKSFAFYFAVVQ